MASTAPAQEVIERLSVTLEAILQRLNKPEFGAAALRAQIMSNARVLDQMYHAMGNGKSPYEEDRSMAINMATEDYQTRASVVFWYMNDDQRVMGTLLRGSLANSDSEALLSLYEDSKIMAGIVKSDLGEKRLWRD